MGEQFIAQALRCIPDRSWLFQYGRVPLNMVLSEWVWSVRLLFPSILHANSAHTTQRLSADVASSARCKLTIIAEATATTSASLPPESLVPFSDHFHPATPKIVQHSLVPENRRVGLPFVAVGIQPLEQQVRPPLTFAFVFVANKVSRSSIRTCSINGIIASADCS
jgi:transcription factor 1